MTLPQRMATADPAPDIAQFAALEALDGSDRGPANAIINRLAQAIADQNVANATVSALPEGSYLGVPNLGWLMALGVGSASLWLAAIMIGRALL